MSKIILGFTGLLASGKGTAAKYLQEKYGASTFRFSTMLRDALDRFYLPQTRDNMIKISEIIRGTFGEDTMARTMSMDAEKSENKTIVVEGVRRPADIEYLKRLPNFVLVEIFADPKIRYERLIKRRENPDDATKTYEQFLADHQRSTELSILDVAAEAKIRLDNNGNLEQLHKQLDDIVSKLQAH